MRAYVKTTGILFVLLVLAHIARAAAEGLQVLTDPAVAASTLISIALTAWAWRLIQNPSEERHDGDRG